MRGESVLSDEPLSRIGGTEKDRGCIHEVYLDSHLIGLLYDQDLAECGRLALSLILDAWSLPSPSVKRAAWRRASPRSAYTKI